MKYQVLLCDNPWPFRVWSEKGKGRSADQHYNTMTMEDLKALPIANICADDCVLFLWVTSPTLPDALDLIQSWGFTYKTKAFTYIKINKNGKPFTGMGYYSRANSEDVLLATRGKPLKRVDKGVNQVILAPRMEHSRKPEEVHRRIDHLFGTSVPKIELFARRQPPEGWHATGIEYDGVDIRDFLTTENSLKAS